MAQRPTVKQPKPLTAPVDPQRLEADAAGLAGARVLGDVKAEVSPEAAPLWEFVLTHARAIALAVLGVIVLIIAVAAWQWYRESAAASARDDLGRIAASLDSRRPTQSSGRLRGRRSVLGVSGRPARTGPGRRGKRKLGQGRRRLRCRGRTRPRFSPGFLGPLQPGRRASAPGQGRGSRDRTGKPCCLRPRTTSSPSSTNRLAKRPKPRGGRTRP